MNDNCQKYKKQQRGLTLIEILLYVSLLSIFITLSVPLFIDLNSWYAKHDLLDNTLSEYLFVKNYIQNTIENTEVVHEPEAGEFSDTLSIRAYRGEELSLQVNSNKQIEVMSNANDWTALHSTSTRIENLSFYRSSVDSGLDKLEFSMTVNDQQFGTTSFLISNE